MTINPSFALVTSESSTSSLLTHSPREQVLEELERDGIAISADQPAEWQIFGFADATETLGRLNVGIKRDAFCEALSLSARQLADLQQGGLLVAERADRYDPLVAQDLVDGLPVGAEPVYVAMHDWCSLTEATKHLKLTLPQLIADIQQGKFLKIGKYLPKSGFASVLVNLGHLGQDDEAISMEAFWPASGFAQASSQRSIVGMSCLIARSGGHEAGLSRNFQRRTGNCSWNAISVLAVSGCQSCEFARIPARHGYPSE